MTAIEFNHQLMGMQSKLGFFAKSLTSDPEDAKDLLQETFFKALTNRDKFQGDKNLKAWVFTIMKNTFINNYRRNAKQKTIFDNTPEDYLINLKQSAVSNAAESSLRIKEIKTAVDRLPGIFKMPFLLYVDGYKYQEISDYLHEPLGTIKSRIHFARKLLKDQISRF